MWIFVLIATQYLLDLLLSMRTFCMRRAKWYMISLLAMGVPIIDGASLRQFCTVGLNISSKVSPDLRLRHFVDQKSGPFYILILHCRRLLEHDTWHLVWWVFHQFLFHTDNCQCRCNLSQNWPQFQVQLTLGHAGIPHRELSNICIPPPICGNTNNLQKLGQYLYLCLNNGHWARSNG